MSTNEDVNVQDNPADNRYEVHADGRLAGFLTYDRLDGVVSLLHTEVLDGFEGRGLAGALVSYVLDDLRRQQLRIEVVCPYVDSYIGRHPEYEDLRA